MPKILAADGLWLRAAVSALVEGGCSDVVVVLGAAVVPVPPPARAVLNPAWPTGMGSSLRAGLAALEETDADLAVLHLVDLPDVGPAVVSRVVAAAEGGLARATYGGRPGHPLAVARRHWPDLAASAVGDQGGRSWLRGRADVVPVACEDVSTGLDRDRR